MKNNLVNYVISNYHSTITEHSNVVCRLACNSECAVIERNRRLALALEIKNPDLSSRLGNPTYSQFLKDYARQNPTFVAGVEKALSELVTAANQVFPHCTFCLFMVPEVIRSC